MSLVTGKHLGKAFGDVDIFQAINVSIPQASRIALVGPNGAGKTTLLRLLAGLDSPSEGQVVRTKGTRLAMLPQEAELSLSGDSTLWDEMLTVFSEIIGQEERLQQIAEDMATHPNDTALLDAYGQAQHDFEEGGGYEYPVRIRQVLGGLGFDEDDYPRPIVQLSGGQRTRALLARLLLEDPDLLILDEPTNHLDIQAIEWLERWLRSFKGALLIVSHDRYFMDSVVSHVWELMFGQLEEYNGNYSHYVRQREERHEFLLKEYERQQGEVSKQQDYIARNIAGQNTRQAQGRRKRLERFLRDEAISRPRQQRKMRIQLDARRQSGVKVLNTKQLVIGYHDDKVPLFNVPNIDLLRGECAALIGPNGAGKSTFLKTILGQLAPLSGESTLGAGVEIGYFAQAHEGLIPERTVLDEILSVKNLPISEARSYLASFMFTSDDVFKTVSALSGGERGRVALAKLALGGANLLLLDEPTNHLDIQSQEILEAVLADFEGTILLVSHDRYLVRDLATQIWALNVPRHAADGGTEMVVYPGPFEEYMAWREGKSVPVKREDPKFKPAEPEAKRQAPRGEFERKKRLTQVETNIHKLEVDLVNLSGSLEAASASGKVDEVKRLGEEYAYTENQLAGLMEEWEGLVADV